MFVGMKYFTTLLALIVFGCNNSGDLFKIKENPEYYTPLHFFDGSRNRSVYSGEVAEIAYSGAAGKRIIMKSGREYSFEELDHRLRPSRPEREESSSSFMHQVEQHARGSAP